MALDPVCDGFYGVMVELRRERGVGEEAYVALAVCTLTGERLVRFVSACKERASEFYEALLGGEGEESAAATDKEVSAEAGIRTRKRERRGKVLYN